MTTSRKRVELALAHKEPDRVPVDLGGTVVSGMHVTTVYHLRQALGLDRAGTPVKVVEPYQMLGEVKPDLIEALGIDVVGLNGSRTMFGYGNEGWKPWTFRRIPVLVPEAFNTEPDAEGNILAYPEGDRSAPASGIMPEGGFYFDALIRQPPIDDENLNVEDNLEEFSPISDQELEYFTREAERLHTGTDKAIVANFGGSGFGDIALVPAPWLKQPKGIRDVEEWYVSTVTRREYICEVFERQCEIALGNLAKLYQAVGDRVTVVLVTGTDFGAQQGPLVSPASYRELFMPFHKRVNNWIHRHTSWRTFIHTCGAVMPLIEDFIEAGFDILNPVQTSAASMEPAELKRKFGNRLTFWGGGVDTQRTLPFGSPDDVRRQVLERLKIFAPGGGYVFNAIHNIQALVPVENILAMFETVRKFGSDSF